MLYFEINEITIFNVKAVISSPSGLINQERLFLIASVMTFVKRHKTTKMYLPYSDDMIEATKNKSSPIEIFVSHILT